MAGDWIKFEVGTSDKPEVWAIAAALNIDPDAAVGKLLRVWGWFDGHTENGNAPSVSKLLLDRLVGVSGFCAAVIAEGWMLDDGKTLSLPNFDRHNGKTAKTRVLTAKRVATHKAKGNADGNANSVSGALPKEEKRRKNKSPDGDLGKPKFIPPTVAQVAEYCQERGNTVNPKTFVDHYAANGWKRGKNKVQDWQACVRTWEQNRDDNRQRNPSQQNSRPSLSDRAQAAADAVFGADPGQVFEGDFALLDEHAPPH